MNCDLVWFAWLVMSWSDSVIHVQHIDTGSADLQAEILSRISHRNVVQFYGVVSSNPNYCIVMGELLPFVSVGLINVSKLNIQLNWLLLCAHKWLAWVSSFVFIAGRLFCWY